MIVLLVMLLVVPALAAAALRVAGLNRGSSIIGGILAGLLLGQTVAGHLWPEQFNQAFVGDHPAHAARNSVLMRQRVELLIADRDGLTPEERKDVRERHTNELVVIDLQIRDATWDHQRGLRLFVMSLAAIVVACSGLNPVPRPKRHQSLIHSAATGAASAIVPAALAFGACRYWWELRVDESLMVAAAMSIGPWMLSEADRAAADDTEIGGARMVQNAGRIASCVAIAVAMAAIGVRFGQRELWMAVPLLLMPLGWLVLRSFSGEGFAKLIAAACERVLIPSLAACVMLGIDFLEHVHFWPIVVILILSDDGRWLGAFLGALSLGGRKGLRTMRLVMGCMSAGPTQLAVTAVGVWTGLVSSQLALSLLLGAALIEVTAIWRRGMASRIIQLEHDLEEAGRGDDNPNDRP